MKMLKKLCSCDKYRIAGLFQSSDLADKAKVKAKSRG